MKLCCNCFKNLFDEEMVCPFCNNNVTLNSDETEEFYLLVEEVRKLNKFKQNSLKKNPEYELVFKYIKYKEEHPYDDKPPIAQIFPNNRTNLSEPNEEYWERINSHTINKHKDTPVITCPYCNSTDTKKIGGASRWLSVGMFGLASKKVGKQWHCNNCGSDF